MQLLNKFPIISIQKTILIKVFVFLAIGVSFAQEGINSNIRVAVLKQNGEYMLSCNTAETYNNGSTSITYKKSRSKANFKILFTGTKTPSKVKKSIEPASVVIKLGKLKDGEYKLLFTTNSTIGNVGDTALLKIANGIHELTFLTKNAIE